jgi:glycosyltransferase involved in cell wall biosynthesis
MAFTRFIPKGLRESSTIVRLLTIFNIRIGWLCEMPKVSVVIPVFNGAATIRRAIDSVLAQDFTDLEIIVIDDGSTDETPSILKEYGKHIKAIRQLNQGVGAARNSGIVAAQGEFVAFLDSDDEWYPHKLRKQVALMEENPSVGLVSSSAKYVDELNVVQQVGSVDLKGRLTDVLLFKNVIVTSSVLVRRSCLESTRPYFRQHLSGGGAGVEDWELWLRLSARCEFIISAEPLVVYFRSKDSYYRKHPVKNLRSLWQSVYNGLLDDELLAPKVRRNWRHLQANICFMAAYGHYENGNVWRARKEMMRAIGISPHKIKWSSALPILFLPPSFRNALKRGLNTRLKA